MNIRSGLLCILFAACSMCVSASDGVTTSTSLAELKQEIAEANKTLPHKFGTLMTMQRVELDDGYIVFHTTFDTKDVDCDFMATRVENLKEDMKKVFVKNDNTNQLSQLAITYNCGIRFVYECVDGKSVQAELTVDDLRSLAKEEKLDEIGYAEAQLKAMVGNVQVPIAVDEMTTLISCTLTDSHLNYTYLVDESQVDIHTIAENEQAMRQAIESDMKTEPLYKRIMANLVITHRGIKYYYVSNTSANHHEIELSTERLIDILGSLY